MHIEVLLAWPDRYLSVMLDLPEGATVCDAVTASGLAAQGEVAGQAVYGVVAKPQQQLRDGDRVELLRPLLLDPKQARRRRAALARSATD